MPSGPGDSYCGIFCGACSIARLGATGRPDAFTACLGSVPAEDLGCGGCKSDVLYPGCRACRLRACAVARGVEHCAECAEYPCRTYRSWQSAAKVLPHVREATTSLAAIRARGVDRWLTEQEERWACPTCGERFSWYARRCGGCGRDLEGTAHALRGIRRVVAGWLLRTAYARAKRATRRG